MTSQRVVSRAKPLRHSISVMISSQVGGSTSPRTTNTHPGSACSSTTSCRSNTIPAFATTATQPPTFSAQCCKPSQSAAFELQQRQYKFPVRPSTRNNVVLAYDKPMAHGDLPTQRFVPDTLKLRTARFENAHRRFAELSHIDHAIKLCPHFVDL